MIDVAFDLPSERFDVRFDPSRTSAAAISGVIRELGFEPHLTLHAEVAPSPSTRIDVESLPPELRGLFAEAERSRRNLLFDFTAPG